MYQQFFPQLSFKSHCSKRYFVVGSSFAVQHRNSSSPIYAPMMMIITGRNEVLAKVMFLQASVILSTGGVCVLQFFGGGVL